jgi:phosphate/sulfate permease
MPRLHTTATATPSLLREDPNYPGIPQPPAGVLTRATTRATVDYPTYVLDYAWRMSMYGAMIGLGLAILSLAAFYLRPPMSYVVGTLALAPGLGGLLGALSARSSHRAFTENLAHAVSETYGPQQVEPVAAQQTDRPFVPSGDRPRTILVGSHRLTPSRLAGLFQAAEADDGRVKRDLAVHFLPRDMYRDWQATVGELQRLGFVDADARPTRAGWAYVRGESPPPPANHTPPGAQSTPARARTHAHGANSAG